jgi:hypothetical protein
MDSDCDVYAFTPTKLNKIFPENVAGRLLLLVGVYSISDGMQNWSGTSNCKGGTGFP